VETVLITITETLPVALKAELELASDFARASKAKATQMAYSSDFRIFDPGAASAVCAFLRHKLALGSGLRLLGAASPRSNTSAMNRIQNHKEGGIGSVYDRHRYSAENQKIMGGRSCGYYGSPRLGRLVPT
jgi:hypothetical protein